METFEIENLSSVAAISGLSVDDVERIAQSDAISERQAGALSVGFGVESAWIRTGDGPFQRLGAEIHGFRGFETGPSQLPEPQMIEERGELTLIPKARARLSAGGGIVPEEGVLAKKYAFRSDWLRAIATSPRMVILFDVRGPSMERLIYDGDTVMIDMGRTIFVDDGIYAIDDGGVLRIKELKRIAGTEIEVISANPEFHSYKADIKDVRILGQCLWSAHTWINLPSIYSL